jgi:uncharacterized protein DUF6624
LNRGPALLCVWVLVLPLTGHCASDEAVLPSTVCPGAAAWKAAHPEDSADAIAQRDQARTFTDPDLRKQLQERFETDQRARREMIRAPSDRDVQRRVDSIDADNLAWLKKLVQDTGIPSAEQVGENGVKWAWALVQHADRDPKLQATVLPQFAKRYEAGELPAEDLAKLTDRILIALGKAQRFGTQFDWLSGKFNPRGVTDLAAIDARRQEIGLMPLADYACMMNDKLKKK